jgi:glutathione S-transferase
MKLLGMLDSPYVRRVAVSLQLLGLRFEHEPLSVFRNFDEFARINPVVKAPTLVCDDGVVLMDSTLMLEYAQALARPRSLVPDGLHELRHDLRIVGLALAACEKSVQLLYERMLRPPERRHEPWVARVSAQMLAAYQELELELGRRPLAHGAADITQGGVSAAIAWDFTQRALAGALPADGFACLRAHSQRTEALPEFLAAPYGDGTCRGG